MYSLNEFNSLSKKQVKEDLFKCCGSNAWVNKLMEYFPFKDEMLLFNQSRIIWYEECKERDFLEAFSHHPKIGDIENLKEKFASTQTWAGKEQAGVSSADENTLNELKKLNEEYFQKFGFIFIVCAAGKTAGEMLRLLETRIGHSKEEELTVAMGEQFKITLIRLKKLLRLEDSYWSAVSQITTHVLDTSIGKPGKGILIKLKQKISQEWQTISLGITNEDGRIADLLPAGKNIPTGNYQMCFETLGYFKQLNIKGFYPKVEIHFTTFDETHYHVPLLINPFGYSTYRGS